MCSTCNINIHANEYVALGTQLTSNIEEATLTLDGWCSKITATAGCGIYLGRQEFDGSGKQHSYANILHSSIWFCSGSVNIGAHSIDADGVYADLYLSGDGGAHLSGSKNVSLGTQDGSICLTAYSRDGFPQINFNALPYYSGYSKEGCSYNNYNYFATQSYVESALEDSLENYQPVSLSIGNGACIVDITTGNGYIAFDDTKIPTTGIDFDKPTPYTCVYWLCECTPVDGIVAWDIRLKCGESDIQSVIPPHVSILRQDSSTGFGGVYVNADVSSVIEEDVGVPVNTTVHIEMASTETIPANTFKAVVSNIYSMCLE